MSITQMLPKAAAWLHFVLLLCVITAVFCNDDNGVSATARRHHDSYLSFLDGLSISRDYSPVHWKSSLGPKASSAFNYYVQRLSAHYAATGAEVHFLSVGSCDGQADKTIDLFLLPSSHHWRGLFIEPVGRNVEDLRAMLRSKGVYGNNNAGLPAAVVGPGEGGSSSNSLLRGAPAAAVEYNGGSTFGRAIVIQGAVTDSCSDVITHGSRGDSSSSITGAGTGSRRSGTTDSAGGAHVHSRGRGVGSGRYITIRRPPDSMLEDPSLPHWQSKELAHIALPNGENPNPNPLQPEHANWVTEEVRCMTGTGLLRTWNRVVALQLEQAAQQQEHSHEDSATIVMHKGTGGSRLANVHDERWAVSPDVVKIDAEGADAQILFGFCFHLLTPSPTQGAAKGSSDPPPPLPSSIATLCSAVAERHARQSRTSTGRSQFEYDATHYHLPLLLQFEVKLLPPDQLSAVVDYLTHVGYVVAYDTVDAFAMLHREVYLAPSSAHADSKARTKAQHHHRSSSQRHGRTQEQQEVR